MTVKHSVPEIISQLSKYKRLLEKFKARWYDTTRWEKELSKTRLANIWIELRISIAELNNYLLK